MFKSAEHAACCCMLLAFSAVAFLVGWQLSSVHLAVHVLCAVLAGCVWQPAWLEVKVCVLHAVAGSKLRVACRWLAASMTVHADA
jgi:hypothetical protein